MMTHSIDMILANDEQDDKEYVKAYASGSVTAVFDEPQVDGEEPKIPTIDIEAYNGGVIEQWWGKTIVDLAGMQIVPNVALLANHNPETPVGHASAESFKITKKSLVLSGGILSGDPEDPDTRRILRMSQNGFPWQASIGAQILKREVIEAGQKVKVNGKTYSGPVTVVRESKLKEVSVLTMGADETTSSKVSAKAEENFSNPQYSIKGEHMGFDQWLKAKGFDLESLEDGIRANLQKIYDAESEQSVEAKDSSEEVDALKAQVAELERVRGIEACTVEHTDLRATALDKGWSVDQAKSSVEEINKIRAERTEPKFNIGSGSKAEGSIEAGFASACGVSEDIIAKEFGEDAVSDSVKAESFSHLAMLKLSEAGKFNPTHSKEEMLRASFSTVGLGNILSNTANKILLGSFESTASVSQDLSVERNVNDFKDVSLMDLTMDLTLKKIGTTGEAQHGTVADDVQTGKVDSYARQFVVDRQMLINDDLGAFQSVFAGYGKGARIAEERNFFNVFTSATAGTTNTGAGSVLSIDGLTQAFTDLGEQVDENGDPIDLSGAILVVPPSLATFARQLQSSMHVIDVTDSASGTPNNNPHMGMFTTVVAPYLNNGNVAGGSATRWYLMANPASNPAFAKMHLVGAPAPVIRQGELPVGSFGVATDAVYDFGATAVSFKAKGVVENAGA